MIQQLEQERQERQKHWEKSSHWKFLSLSDFVLRAWILLKAQKQSSWSSYSVLRVPMIRGLLRFGDAFAPTPNDTVMESRQDMSLHTRIWLNSSAHNKTFGRRKGARRRTQIFPRSLQIWLLDEWLALVLLSLVAKFSIHPLLGGQKKKTLLSS